MPTNDWLSISEICMGLVLTKRVDINKFHPTMFYPPYDSGFAEYKNSGSKEKVISCISQPNFDAALSAAQTVSDTNDIEWHTFLKKRMALYTVGDAMEKTAKKFKRGEELDTTNVMELASSLREVANPQAVGLVSTKNVDWEHFEELEPSGWDAIDENLGGVVKAGNILVMGRTGLGKSFFSTKFLCKYLTKYPDRTAAVYSLEMPSEQWISRAMKLYPKEFSAIHESGRVLVSDKNVTIDDVGIEAAAAGVSLIIVDYIDYLIHGDFAENSYAKVYIGMNSISRTLKIPFMMLLQPNRMQYSGSGVPEMWYARYSGMAENVAAQFWALWQPKDEEETNGDFVYLEDSMYILAHKQRAGWPIKQGPGAIVLPRVKNIWDDGPGIFQMRGDVPVEIKRGKRKKSND